LGGEGELAEGNSPVRGDLIGRNSLGGNFLEPTLLEPTLSACVKKTQKIKIKTGKKRISTIGKMRNQCMPKIIN